MIGDVLDDLGRETAELIAKSGATAVFTHLDITDESSWQAAVTATVAELGGYDILVNNAGVEVTDLMVDLDPAELSRMLEVNIVGTALGIKHAFRAMRPGGVGRRRRLDHQHLLGCGHHRASRASPATRRPSPRSTD